MEQNVTKTGKEFGVDCKMVRDWIAKEEELRAHNKGEHKKKRKLSSGGELACEEMDMAVLDYLVDERANGRVLSNLNLKSKTLEIARDFPHLSDLMVGWGTSHFSEYSILRIFNTPNIHYSKYSLLRIFITPKICYLIGNRMTRRKTNSDNKLGQSQLQTRTILFNSYQ
jgi:hypothetical protein